MSELTKDYGLKEVAQALGMSERWVRDRIKEGQEGEGPAIEHIRYGESKNAKIRFTAEQVEKLRGQFTKAAPLPQSITTGRKKRSA